MRSEGEVINLLRDGWRFRAAGPGKKYIVISDRSGRRTRGTGLKNSVEDWEKARDLEAKARMLNLMVEQAKAPTPAVEEAKKPETLGILVTSFAQLNILDKNTLNLARRILDLLEARLQR